MADTNTIIPDNAAALLAAGKSIGAEPIIAHGGKPVVIVPERYKVEILSVPPERISNSVVFTDVDSFAAYVERFKTPGTLIFATLTDTDCKLMAYLDHHDKPFLDGAARERNWSSHRAALTCVQTKEWKTWMENNGGQDPFTQEEFARFLEDNDRVFKSPDAASLLELVTTLEGKNNVRFNQAVRLHNGRFKLDYEEDVELRAGQDTGSIEIPSELLCLIVPFENGPNSYPVRARLRYRIANRQIVFWYETVTPHLILRDAAKSVMDAVREKLKDVPLLIGG